MPNQLSIIFSLRLIIILQYLVLLYIIVLPRFVIAEGINYHFLQNNYLFLSQDKEYLGNNSKFTFEINKNYQNWQASSLYSIENRSLLYNGSKKINNTIQSVDLFWQGFYGKIGFSNKNKNISAYFNKYQVEYHNINYLLMVDHEFNNDNQIITQPGLWSSQNGPFHHSNNKNYYYYYSPKIRNIIFGFAYAPTSKISDFSCINCEKNYIAQNHYREIKKYSLQYGRMIDEKSGIKLSYELERGRAIKTSGKKCNHLQSYEISTSISYLGIIYSFSYSNHRHGVNLNKERGFGNSILYHFGPIILDIKNFKSYQKTEIDLNSPNNKKKFLRNSIQLGYKLSQGITPYIEMTNSHYHQKDKINKIKGVLLGFNIKI